MSNTEGLQKRVDPSWVQSFLEACQNEDGIQRSSGCNHRVKFLPGFCITCQKLFCRICPEFKRAKHPHERHQVLLVHKASGENCLRAIQLSKLIDISDIHPFIVENEQVVFVHRRACEQTKSGRNKSCNTCKTCGRELQGQTKFCSIQCKNESGENMSLIKQKAEGKGDAEEGEIEDEPPVEGQSYRKRRRKGVPSRSPFL
ncbi:hypothetical protein QN277_027812 [Acacia crassicarpa]|uniref:Uncharacterized protein n=1 Tax=Acacia crassicarpa TaxID=499986 RepID=A0AAE1J1Z9_9FABA|nr:hypothetical protein QN277_027812 [Acacia crassicarpa]